GMGCARSRPATASCMNGWTLTSRAPRRPRGSPSRSSRSSSCPGATRSEPRTLAGALPAEALDTRSRPGRSASPRANEVALALRQPVDDQFVTVLEEPEDKLVGQGVVERDGDPVTLVEVVSGSDSGVLGAERLGQRRLALEADGQWARVEGRQSEHLPGDLEDGGLRAEGGLLDRRPPRQAPDAQRIGGHVPEASCRRPPAGRPTVT